jgi:hypothetical protein
MSPFSGHLQMYVNNNSSSLTITQMHILIYVIYCIVGLEGRWSKLLKQ